jgi:exodeoxyribonuclease VII small subunit
MTLSEPNKNTSAPSFEEAFKRLEEILEKINSGATTLEESLELYEEADKLMIECSKKLSEAEAKVEMLIKNRTGELQLGQDNKPLTQDFPK